MSDIPTDIENLDDTSSVGETSEVVQNDPPEQPWYRLDLFNTLLLISFVLITLSSMLMIWHLIGQYGSPTSAPWNV